MTVVLYCTGRGTHAPVAILAEAGPFPLPGGKTFYNPHSVMDLYCDRKQDGCGRAPRAGHSQLRELLNAVAGTPGQMFDISYWDL